MEENDSDSGDEMPTSFFAPQIQTERTKAEARARKLAAAYFIFCTAKNKALDIGKALATYRDLYVVQKGQLKRRQFLAKAMSPGACRVELEANIATTLQQVQCLKDQITVLETMIKACAAADDTTDPATFFNALAKSGS